MISSPYGEAVFEVLINFWMLNRKSFHLTQVDVKRFRVVVMSRNDFK